MMPSLSPVLGFSLGGPEIILILCVLILLFGAKKLPELARGIGKSMKELKKASSEDAAEEPTEADLKAQLAAAKSELAATKAKNEANKTHGQN